jgi:hypothetical protein
VDCAGKFVYAPDWYLSTVSAYAINAQTGALTAVPRSPFPAGNSPEAVVATCPAVLPPAISNVSASPSVLWPPNHDFVNVTISYDVTSTISATCNLNVSSNEPGSGEWDVEDADHVLLRAERNGSGMGRIYTVTIDCVNAEGNATAETTVVVPHDQNH